MSGEVSRAQANKLGRGKLIILKERPCKVVETSHCKTGKHGSGKTSFTALDIFTGKKIMTSCPATSMVEVPLVKKETLTVADVHDGHVDVFDENDEMMTSYIACTEEEEKKISDILDEGDCQVVVISWGDEKKIDQIKKE